MNDEKDIKVEHVSVLSNMVKQCPGCYVDYQEKTMLHGNKLTQKLKNDKKKKRNRKETRRKEGGVREETINEVMNKDAVQPPETSIPRASKDASESYTLNDQSSSSNNSSGEIYLKSNRLFFGNEYLCTSYNQCSRYILTF